MNSKLKIAIVGVGIWGINHGKLYNEHPMCELVAVCDQNKATADTAAQLLGCPEVYYDYQEMMQRCDFDAIAIVTPDFAHADIAICAANAKKHMIIEKPLATTRDEVFRMVEAIEKNAVRVMVDFHNRWSPPFYATWEAIRKGELGELYSAYFRLNDVKWVATDMLSWAASSSILWFLGSHSLDTLRWLFDDEVKRVYAVSREGILKGLGVDTVDMYQTTIEFAKGGIAQMENGWITPNANPCLNDIKCTLLGTKGMVTIDASNHNLIQKYTDERVTVPDTLVQHTIQGVPKGFAFESIRTFVDRMIDGKDFPVSLKDAANTSLALLAIMESAKTREPVDVIY